MPRKAAGFTIIELLVVVAMVAILATVAAPAFSTMIKTSKIKGAASNLQMSMLKARGEAVKRNASVRVQRAGANWTAGWSVVVVSDGTVLEALAALDGASVTSATNPPNVTYLGSGRVQNNLTPTFTVNANPAFTSATVKNDRCRNVVVGTSGIPSVRPVDCP